jgi:hypothetical protein
LREKGSKKQPQANPFFLTGAFDSSLLPYEAQTTIFWLSVVLTHELIFLPLWKHSSFVPSIWRIQSNPP